MATNPDGAPVPNSSNVTRPTVLVEPFMFDLRPKYLHVPKDAFQKFNISGKKTSCPYYTPDGSIEARSLVFYICMKTIQVSTDRHQICSMFASALSALAPDLEKPLLECLEEKDIIPQVIKLPSQGAENHIMTEYKDQYTPEEVNMFFTCGLMLCFKGPTRENYPRFIEAWTRDLSGHRLGDLERRNFPLTFEKVLKIRPCFGGNVDLKWSIIRYLMSACNEDGDIRSFARYACGILAWSELEVFVYITLVLVRSQSPVLQNPFVQAELRAYKHAMLAITSSDVPQFFIYYCSAEHEEMLQRQNVETLAAVAEKILLDAFKSTNLHSFTSTTEKGSPMVEYLVGLHNRFLAKNNMLTDISPFRLLYEDEDCPRLEFVVVNEFSF